MLTVMSLDGIQLQRLVNIVQCHISVTLDNIDNITSFLASLRLPRSVIQVFSIMPSLVILLNVLMTISITGWGRHHHHHKYLGVSTSHDLCWE